MSAPLVDDSLIELVDIAKTYSENLCEATWVLQNIHLHFQAGQLVAFCGPSGSGKTTLLSIIGCLCRPSRGRVRFRGEDISGLPERFLTQLRRQSFGFVFQNFNLIHGLSALENVMLPAYPLGLPFQTLVKKARAALEQFDMDTQHKSLVEKLSGGQQQRVALARAFINAPAVLIADEPTAHLDTALTESFIQLLAKLKAQGTTLLLSSHDKRLLDSPLVDRHVVLEDGRVVQS